mmetsp:Transcript_47888/g.126955  ORF Transcript_47888/g.126955 Transcript_47888/m.126955 type:complete len:141 (-) Transcript_47888:51-473(-)
MSGSESVCAEPEAAEDASFAAWLSGCAAVAVAPSLQGHQPVTKRRKVRIEELRRRRFHVDLPGTARPVGGRPGTWQAVFHSGDCEPEYVQPGHCEEDFDDTSECVACRVDAGGFGPPSGVPGVPDAQQGSAPDLQGTLFL